MLWAIGIAWAALGMLAVCACRLSSMISKEQ